MIDELDPKTEWIRVDEAGMMGLNFCEEGKLQLVSVRGNMICIARKNNQLFAIKNRCPHSGGPFHQGHIDEEGNIVCPWHRFKFCLEDGRSAGGEGYASEVFPLQIEPDGLYVGLPRRKKWLGLF
jgi:3-phenylpropionate/trans-cinnamate dioxygenase ferredoxin subunit